VAAAGDVLGGGGGKGNFKCWSLGVVYFCLVHYLNGCYVRDWYSRARVIVGWLWFDIM